MLGKKKLRWTLLHYHRERQKGLEQASDVIKTFLNIDELLARGCGRSILSLGEGIELVSGSPWAAVYLEGPARCVCHEALRSPPGPASLKSCPPHAQTTFPFILTVSLIWSFSRTTRLGLLPWEWTTVCVSAILYTHFPGALRKPSGKWVCVMSGVSIPDQRKRPPGLGSHFWRSEWHDLARALLAPCVLSLGSVCWLFMKAQGPPQRLLHSASWRQLTHRRQLVLWQFMLCLAF